MTRKDHLVEINRRPRPESSPLPQSTRFEQMARELGLDKDEGAFRAKLAEIVRSKPIAKKAGMIEVTCAEIEGSAKIVMPKRAS